MRKMLFISICLFHFVFSILADNLKFKYEGARMNNYGVKSYDPSGGIIDVNFDSKNVKIYLGPYKVFFNACPIDFNSIREVTNNDTDKIYQFNDSYTIDGEKCLFYINMTKAKATFKMGTNNGFIIDFEDLIYIK